MSSQTPQPRARHRRRVTRRRALVGGLFELARPPTRSSSSTAPVRQIVGVNEDCGDTAALRNIRIHGDAKRRTRPGVRYEGNDQGKEPPVVSAGPYGRHRDHTPADITYR